MKTPARALRSPIEERPSCSHRSHQPPSLSSTPQAGHAHANQIFTAKRKEQARGTRKWRVSRDESQSTALSDSSWSTQRLESTRPGPCLRSPRRKGLGGLLRCSQDGLEGILGTPFSCPVPRWKQPRLAAANTPGQPFPRKVTSSDGTFCANS